MTAERIDTPLRRILRDQTAEWTREYIDPIAAHAVLQRKLGQTAGYYDDYISIAITSGGYRRDSSLTYGQAVAENTAYALDMADELHRHGLIDVRQSLDSVALGKVAPWKQSDYLTFFFMAMTRPFGTSPGSVDEAADIQARLRECNSANMHVFNDETMTNDQRFPEYQRFVDGFRAAIADYDIAPIGRMIRLLDWQRSLGSRAEESLARQLGITVVTPMVATSTHDLSGVPIAPELRAKIAHLESLGAETLASQPPTLVLV
ncbi:MAG TPA: hypothetical protein PKV96_01270 [Candidatus Saccharimonas sp.]|jgi:hypothetical protein|nr:hypothetical protein [Candidatus Saccharimonas sp.]